jgi:transposase
MFIKESTSRGHRYYSIVVGERCRNIVTHKAIQQIGRLDNLTEPRRLELEKKVQELGGSDLLNKFRQLLFSLGYSLPTLSLDDIDLIQALDYGDVFLFHQLWMRLTISDIIERHTIKGGGIPLPQLTEILVVNRLCVPGSREWAAKWYRTTYLPVLLKLPASKVYARTLLRALEYLQPERTRIIEKEIYDQIRKLFGIEPSRVDLDITSIYFEGEECILAEFGYNRDGKNDKMQIVVGLAVDQAGFLLTHFVFPGNRTDVTTLKRATHALRKDYGVTKTLFVMDRGMISNTNIKYMDRKKDEYLVALKLNKHEKALVNEMRGSGKDPWVKHDEKITAILLDKTENGRKKRYMLGKNGEIAGKLRLERKGRIQKARRALRSLKRSIKKGKTKSRKERERRIGGILKSNGVKRFFVIRGVREGLDFTFKLNQEKIAEVEKWDGVFVMVTTDMTLSIQDIIGTYRVRDQVEKAIRTLKSVLVVRPVNVREVKQVYGHIFVCALAYQLRRVAQQYLKLADIDMSIDDVLETFKRLKVVDIRVNKDEVQVQRKMTMLDDKQRMLVETFRIGDEIGQLSA